MQRAPRLCSCGLTVAYGHLCPCQRERAMRAKDHRAGARERGYDRAWEALAAKHRRAHPRCVECGAPAQAVDHVLPVRERPDLRLDPSNLQSLCRSHHQVKTAAETKARAGGGSRHDQGGRDRWGTTKRNSPDEMSVRSDDPNFFGVA